MHSQADTTVYNSVEGGGRGGGGWGAILAYVGSSLTAYSACNKQIVDERVRVQNVQCLQHTYVCTFFEALHVYESKIIPRRAQWVNKFLILFVMFICAFAAMIRLFKLYRKIQCRIEHLKFARGAKCAKSYMTDGYSYETKISPFLIY
jgi:hypothetical protein